MSFNHNPSRIYVMAIVCVLEVFIAPRVNAQLTGTLTIPGNYATIADAVTVLNGQGVGPGGVTFNVAAGHSESSASEILLTATGTMANPIVFQKSGVGPNPLVSRTDAGSNTTSTFGGLGDAVIQLNGSDYVTIDGIDVAAIDQGIEYGYFTFKPSTTDGCQFMTIMNCVVTMTKGTSAYVIGIYISNGPASTSSAVGVVVSDNSGRNENVTIIGNTISNVHAGIALRGSSAATFNDQNPVVGQSGMGNMIQNYGGGSSTATYGVYLIYQVNPTVSYNTIDNAGGGGSAHASTLYGIFHSTAVTGDIVASDNSITLNTSATSGAQWIYNGNTAGSVTISNNTLAGTIAATTTSYLIYNNTSTVGGIFISNNQSSGIDKSGASGTLYGYYNNGSPGSGTEEIFNNDFSNISLTGTSIFTGINSTTASGHTQNIYNNTITNITGDHTGTTIGINVTTAGSRNIYGNSIHDISGAGLIRGIANGSGGTTELNIYKNTIYNLNSTSEANTAGLVSGILVSAGTTNSVANIYNNLIGNLDAGKATGTDAVRGINITQTTASTGIWLSYNTIYLSSSSVGANFGTSGIYHTGSATATTAALTMRNNIIVNLSIPNGTGLTVAYRRSSTNLANYGDDSNNNLFFAGTPGPANLIFYDGTNAHETLLDYINWVMPRDLASVTENPPFLSTVGSNPNFLHIDTTIPTLIESGGAPVTGITDDYDGDARNGSTPDIGADEFAGTSPTCVGAPAASNTLVSPTPPLCNGESFTLSLSESYTAVQYQWQSSPDDNMWTDINGATFEILITSTSVTTYYRAVITCVSSAMSTNSVSVLVTIPTNLSGAYTIDNTMPTGGTNYNDFVDAIDDLSCRGVSAPVTFSVIAGQVFPSLSGLNLIATGSMANPITFMRSGAGANPLIQSVGTSGTTDYILRIGGGDYITFEGIDFEQTGTSATDWVEYGIYLQNASTTDGAKNNTFRNGTVTMSNQNPQSKGVYVHTSPTPTSLDGTNSSNRFLNMTVTSSWEGYRIAGATTTFPDDGNEISTDGGMSVIQNLGDATTSGSVYGVFATYQTNFKVKNTEISNLTPGSTSLTYGITLQTSAANSAEISGNNIHDITGGGTVKGIYMTSVDTADIFNNKIHALRSTTATSSEVRGIDITATGANVNIYANQIYNISSDGLTTTTAGGIDVATGLGFNIHDNMISDIRAPASTTTTGGTRGISVSGGSSGDVVRIYHNTILLTDVGVVAGYTSAGIHNSSTTPTLDIRNNIVINNSDVTTGTRAVAFWKTSATDNVDNASNTNLYYAGTPGVKNLIYYDGTTSAQTIAEYNVLPAIAPGEAFSVTEDVAFAAIIDGILRPNSATPTLVESSGLLVAGYESDFENTARGPYPIGGQVNGGGFSPDLGADEGDFMYITPALPDCPTLNEPADGTVDLCPYQTITLTWTPAMTGGFPVGGYDVYFGTSMTPPFLTNTSASSYTPSGVLADQTYYWKIVPKNGSGEAVGCTTFSFSTIDAEITSTTPGGLCAPGSVMLSATGTGTLNWYDVPSGGMPLGTGTNFNTPNINSTTDFYVSATAGFAMDNVGATIPGSAGTYTLEGGLLFDVFTTFTLEGVYIYPIGTGAGTVEIALESGGNTLETLSFPCDGTASPGVATFVPLNWTITPGSQYLLNMTSRTGLVASLIRDLSGDIVGGPIASNPDMTVPGVVTITSGQLSGSGTSTTYYFFYNWEISLGCASPRIPVTAAIDDGNVFNDSNSGPGSLRANILCAVANDVITFHPNLLNQTITLSSAIVIDKNLTISGLGMANLTLSGGGTTNIFQVLPGISLTIEDIALKDGVGSGAIDNQGSLFLEDVQFENNFPFVLTGPGSVDISGTVNVNDKHLSILIYNRDDACDYVLSLFFLQQILIR